MDFKQKLIEINENTVDEQKKLIHFKSLRNFINYYDVSKKEKIEITKLLEEYISLIQKNNYDFTSQQSIEAYQLFIYPLGSDYYRKHLGFASVLGFYFIY